MKHITILGEGAWGTAIATLLARNGYDVVLWCYHKDLVESINATHINHRFLPGITLDKRIKAVHLFEDAFSQADWIFEAIPVQYLRSILMRAKPYVSKNQQWVVLSKGIEQGTLLFPSQIIDEVFEKKVAVTAVSGPSFALEVVREHITAIMIAAADYKQGFALVKLLENEYFKPYITTDLIGVQVGAALKNLITIGIGLLDGAGYTDNAKAFLLTCGLHEMGVLSVVLGAQRETIYTLAGVGDLVLTAMGRLSRNLEIGQQLGQGKQLNQILQARDSIPEGINTVQSVYQLMQIKHLTLPVCKGIYDIIFANASVKNFLQQIMKVPYNWDTGKKRGNI